MGNTIMKNCQKSAENPIDGLTIQNIYDIIVSKIDRLLEGCNGMKTAVDKYIVSAASLDEIGKKVYDLENFVIELQDEISKLHQNSKDQRLYSDFTMKAVNNNQNRLAEVERKHNRLLEIMMLEANPKLKSKLKKCCVKIE